MPLSEAAVPAPLILLPSFFYSALQDKHLLLRLVSHVSRFAFGSPYSTPRAGGPFLISSLAHHKRWTQHFLRQIFFSFLPPLSNGLLSSSYDAECHSRKSHPSGRKLSLFRFSAFVSSSRLRFLGTLFLDRPDVELHLRLGVYVFSPDSFPFPCICTIFTVVLQLCRRARFIRSLKRQLGVGSFRCLPSLQVVFLLILHRVVLSCSRGTCVVVSFRVPIS